MGAIGKGLPFKKRWPAIITAQYDIDVYNAAVM